MTSLRGWLNRVVSSLRRPWLDDRLKDEIEVHLEMATSENIARGMPPVAALATVRVVRTLLYGVTPQDPLTLAGAAACLIAIAILACAVPASRAAQVDPLIALRGE